MRNSTTLLTTATALVALLGAASAFAAPAGAYAYAGETEALQPAQAVHSSVSRAEVRAQAVAALKDRTQYQAGESYSLPTVSTTPALERSRDEVRQETLQALRRGQLAGAGEWLPQAQAAAMLRATRMQ